MSIFIHSLKKSGYLDRIQIKVCIVGSRKINNQDDYGSQGWEIFAPNLTIYGFDADAETCSEANTNLNSRQVSWTEKHIPVGLSDTIGKSKLYVTKYPGCSSLYPPSESYIERFAGNSELIRLVDIIEIETTTLDEFCNSEGIEEIDFIQLDVQGAELCALKGAASILERCTLGIITEVEFTELYTGQPLFGDIDVYLRQQGFTLFDLSNQHRDIRRVLLTSEKHRGVLVWSDAFYFRDLINQNVSNQHLQTPEKILKLACIADVLSFPDYTLELLIYLTLQYGADEKYNFADIIIECLAQIPGIFQEWKNLSDSPIVKQVISYSSSCRIGSINTSSIGDLQFPFLLSKAAYQYLLLGDYSQAATLYEKAIELEPSLQSNYWYLGLILLLEGEDAEAQSVWFFGINQGESEKIDYYLLELIEVLQTEAIRRKKIADNFAAVAILEAIKVIAPENLVSNIGKVKYSHLDEECIIGKYLNSLDIKDEYCVDIAASDGITMSNTCFLYEQNWSGLAIECDSEKFAALAANYRNFPNVILSKSFITPDNAIAILEAHQVPKNFGLLNLDIDGYDYFVLDKILSLFRPSLICTEINEKIPPPLKFTVKWDSNYVWENNHFYGQSISQLYLLCEKYDYSLVELHYNNAFLIPKELNPHLSLTPDEAYRHGYLECSDRQNKFPWNADFEEIHSLAAEQALDYVNKFFANYQGKYICSL
jgi:FkbM family methyltransferase